MPLVKNAKDFWAGTIYITIGVSALVISRDYEMGTAFKMGPAYLPMVLGGLLILIGSVSLGRSLILPGSPITGFEFKGLAFVTASTLLFGALVRGAGLVIALPLLVIISAAASSQFRWKYALIMAAGLTLFCILIFLKGLGIPLPAIGPWFGG